VPPFEFHDPSRRVVNSYFVMQAISRQICPFGGKSVNVPSTNPSKVDGFVPRIQACQLENIPWKLRPIEE
jgi:hypothetical protein